MSWQQVKIVIKDLFLFVIKRFVAISFRHSEWKEGKKTDIEKREMMEVKKLSTFSLSSL